MKHPIRSHTARALAARSALATCAAALAACSGEYPLGDMSAGEQLLASEETGAATPADAALSPILPPADVTIGLDDAGFSGPGNVAAVGDLDGDGREELAVAGWDYDTQTPYVQLRYGGPRPTTRNEAFAYDRSGALLLLPDGLDNTGLFVTPAGDVDADGFGDLLIRTLQCSPSGPHEGAYLVYGDSERLDGAHFLPELAVRFVPPVLGDPRPEQEGAACNGGQAAAGAGDLDGDGTDDLVLTVTAFDGKTGSPDFDRSHGAYVFYGRSERFSGEVPFDAADAHLSGELEVDAFPAGDVNGDGLADLLLGSQYFGNSPHDAFFLPGSTTRLSGPMDLAATALGLEGAAPSGTLLNRPLGDLDGDGIGDVLLRQGGGRDVYLFYGAPGLFAEGVDFRRGARLLGNHVLDVMPAGDRDGDGDDDFADVFAGYINDVVLQFEVGVVSGSPERLSGDVVLPEAEVQAANLAAPRFPNEPNRRLTGALPAGDLDGDGASEFITISDIFADVERDGSYTTGFLPQLHIHYGTPAPASTTLR